MKEKEIKDKKEIIKSILPEINKIRKRQKKKFLFLEQREILENFLRIILNNGI